MPCGPKRPIRQPQRRRTNEQTNDSGLQLFSRTPIFTDAVVDPLDSRYFWFFLATMPQVFNYTELFPSIVSDIFSQTLDNVCVKYSVLSISSMIADFRLQRSLERFEVHYIVSLRKIQEAINKNELDQGLAIAVFLITWIDAVRARMSSCRKHLHGLSLIIQQLQPCVRNPMGGSVTSPFLMLIWRLAIRLDCQMSFHSQREPVLQMAGGAEDFHRRWITKITTAGDATEWALSAFALDTIVQKTLIYGIQVYRLRRASASVGNSQSPELTQRKIRSLVGILRSELNLWRERPIIQHTLRCEELAAEISSLTVEISNYTTSSNPVVETINVGNTLTVSDSNDEFRFLHYPKLHIQNSLFINLLITWRAISILISLIEQPRIGWKTCPARFRYAVEICRSVAALGEDRGRTGSYKHFPIFLTLVAFGSDSPNEWQWVFNKAKELGVRFPFSRSGYAVFERLWRSDGDFWEEMAKTNPVTNI